MVMPFPPATSLLPLLPSLPSRLLVTRRLPSSSRLPRVVLPTSPARVSRTLLRSVRPLLPVPSPLPTIFAPLPPSTASPSFVSSLSLSLQLARGKANMLLVHTDHCAKKLLPWLDGMLDEDEKFFKANGVPLFSSHMIDLSGKLEPNECDCYHQCAGLLTCYYRGERRGEHRDLRQVPQAHGAHEAVARDGDRYHRTSLPTCACSNAYLYRKLTLANRVARRTVLTTPALTTLLSTLSPRISGRSSRLSAPSPPTSPLPLASGKTAS